MSVERPQTTVADAQVAEGADPTVLRIGLVTRLTSQRVVSIGSAIHGFVPVKAVEVRLTQRLGGNNGVCPRQWLVRHVRLPGEVKRPGVGIFENLHFRIKRSVTAAIHWFLCV